MTTLLAYMSDHKPTRSNSFLLLVAASLLALFAIAPRAALAQGDCADCDVSGNANPTNSGTEFMLCFEQNSDVAYDPEDSGYLEIFVATLSQPATVTITCKHFPSLKKVISLAANSSQTYFITHDTTNDDLWVVSNDTVDDRVVSVVSTAPIVCSGLNYKYLTADATMALPESSSATDYRIMSYQNSDDSSINSLENTPSQFAVAAFNDNTTVTITPSVPTLGGHAAGAPFSIILNSGECVQVQTDENITGLDLTGTTVSSSNPNGNAVIAVYAGHARTEIPSRYVNNLGATSRDMLWESMPPTSSWGQNFVLDALNIDNSGDKRPEGDLMRVLALNDNTTVTVNGQSWTKLNHNQYQDSLIKGPVLVQGSGSLLVGEIAHTATTIDGNGDPFLAIVPSVDQTNNNFTFLLYSNPAFEVNNVIIATDTRSMGNLSMDGNPIPVSLPFESVPGSVNGESYSILEYGFPSTDQGPHTITSSALNGFTILTYGLGSIVSYGYAGGSLLVPKRAIQIEYPPQSAGGRHSDTVYFRNTCYMPDYVDSAIFVPSNPKNAMYGIHFAENVAIDVDRLAVGASAQIHLVANGPLGSPVSGTVKIYCHTPAQFNLEPAEMPFTLYPDAGAGVQPGDVVQIEATASPNPFSSVTNINFSMPATGDVTIVLYDELGRVVQNVASGVFPVGPYSVRMDRRGLANGFYTCVISSEQLNFKKRIAIVAGE